jgi:hypothetical protein
MMIEASDQIRFDQIEAGSDHDHMSGSDERLISIRLMPVLGMSRSQHWQHPHLISSSSPMR